MTISRNGFQTVVQRNQAPASIGQRASQNPMASALAGEGAFRSTSALDYLGVDPANPIVGNFAWAQGLYASRQKPVGAAVLGFIMNELQTVIPFLPPLVNPNPVRMAVQSGFPVTLQTHGDFWTTPVAPVNGIVSPGDTVYARQYDGAATNDPEAFAATGVQALTTLTVSAVTKGALVPGMVVDSSGADATVIAQLTGTPGGAGTYTVSTSATVGSGAITVAAVDTGYRWASGTTVTATATGVSIAAGTGLMTVTTVTAGALEIGQNVNGTGVPANLFITGQVSGTPGGAGVYQVNSIGPAVASFTGSFTQGQLAKISRTY